MKKSNKHIYLINNVQKIRARNNVNWMNILKLAFKHAPKEAGKLMKKIIPEYVSNHSEFQILDKGD